MFTLEQIEAALGSGKLWVSMNPRAYWRARRNGKTRRWVRSPGRFEIPIKMGLKGYGCIDQDAHVGTEWGEVYVISATQPIKGETRFVREMKEAVLS